MSEKQKIAPSNHENQLLTEQLHDEGERRTEKLREKLEKAERNHHEQANERDVLAKARELAEKQEAEATADNTSPAERRRGPITKKQLNNSFNSQMSHAREHMSPMGRVFSKFIHAKPVEAVSDFVGSTVARPNALLTGSIVAFLTVTILYFTASHFGFRLSGFETIGAFIIGWFIGIIYDYASVAFRSHKNDK